MNHSAFDHLPVAVFAMAPELAALSWPQESRSTCTNCAVGGPVPHSTPERPFDASVRCCTYYPSHPNYLVGQALRRGGLGAERVREQIAAGGEGITVLGVVPTAALAETWKERGPDAFGRDADLLCPYFISGATDACSVWHDRGAVCRTWFCRHDEGPRGRSLWNQVRRVLRSVERRLAACCIACGEPPSQDVWPDPDAVEAWYRWCAEHVESLTPAEAVSLRDPQLEERIRALEAKHAVHARPLPEFLGPHIRKIEPHEDGGFRAAAFTPLDVERLPDNIFQLLSRLDGHTAWADAVAGANEAVGEAAFDRAFMEFLWHRGLVEERDPDAPDPEPGMSAATLVSAAWDDPI